MRELELVHFEALICAARVGVGPQGWFDPGRTASARLAADIAEAVVAQAAIVVAADRDLEVAIALAADTVVAAWVLAECAELPISRRSASPSPS